MNARYSAELLLDKAWDFDPAELAEVIAERFPQMGPVELAHKDLQQGRGDAVLDVDGASVELVVSDTRLEAGVATPALRPVRDWDPEPALTLHRAHVQISCGGPGDGTIWSKAYASVVTIVAGAMAMLGPGAAVRYPLSGATLTTEAAYEAGRTALRGVSPLDAWVTIYAFTPDNPVAQGSYGAFSKGLAPFIGRELALAPAPITPAKAVERIKGAAWAALDGDEPLRDGVEFRDPTGAHSLTVKAAREWVRPGVPVLVLMDADTIVDPETLSIRQPSVPLSGLAPQMPSKESVRAAVTALPQQAKARSREALEAAAPLIGKGAAALSKELQHAPAHGRAAMRFASVAGGAAMRRARAGVSAGRSWLADRKARREEER